MWGLGEGGLLSGWGSPPRSGGDSARETPPSAGSRTDRSTPPGECLAFPLPRGDLERKPLPQVLCENVDLALVDRLYAGVTAAAIPPRRPGSPHARAGSPRRPGSPEGSARRRLRRRRRRGAGSPKLSASPRHSDTPVRPPSCSSSSSGEGAAAPGMAVTPPAAAATPASPGTRAPAAVCASAGASMSFARESAALVVGLPLRSVAPLDRDAGDDSEYEERLAELVGLLNRPNQPPSAWLQRAQAEAEAAAARRLELAAERAAEGARLAEMAEQAAAAEEAAHEARRAAHSAEAAAEEERVSRIEAEQERDETRQELEITKAQLRDLRGQLLSAREREAAHAQSAAASRARERRVDAALQEVRQQLEGHAALLDEASGAQLEAHRAGQQRDAAQALVRELQVQLRERESALRESEAQLRAAAQQGQLLAAARRSGMDLTEQLRRLRIRRDEEVGLLELSAQEAAVRAGEQSALLEVAQARAARASAAAAALGLRMPWCSPPADCQQQTPPPRSPATPPPRAATAGRPSH